MPTNLSKVDTQEYPVSIKQFKERTSLESLQDAIRTLRKGTNGNHRVHHDAIDALTTPQQVVAYDISTGWV